jgi:ABC-type nitrate/sulfonate/bicarbonate transport system permease component
MPTTFKSVEAETAFAQAPTPFAAATAAAVASAKGGQRRRRALGIVLGLGFPLALLGLWEALAAAGMIDRRFFPPPSAIGQAAVTLVGDPVERAALVNDLLASGRRIGASYALGSILGIVTGIVMALSPPVRLALGPLINAAYPTPKLAVFPLFIVIFGLGDASKIALITFGVFFMTCMSTLSGVMYSNPIYRDVAQAFQFPRRTTWLRVVVPAALPAIVTGLKLGLGQALILVVSTEMVSGEDGIGHFIWESWQVLNISRMFIGLIIAALAGGAAMLIGDFVERALTPWANH